MADKKISALTSASVPLAGTEVLPIVQSGSTVKVSVNDLTAGKAVTASQITIENNSANAAVRITQTGAGNALLVEDEANPDATPFVVNTTGNVGIGTTGPDSKLHVEGTAGLRVGFLGGSTNYYSADTHLFFNGNLSSEGMRIDSAGNVGIGTSGPAATAILDVQSTTKGVRFPNMTSTQKNAFTPSAGTVVFDTTLAKLCVYSGAAWQTITSI